MEAENKYNKMSESEAMSECQSEIFWLVSDLMDAHGRWSGKEVLEKVLDEFIENGYFYSIS